jgi:hypothetical protein
MNEIWDNQFRTVDAYEGAHLSETLHLTELGIECDEQVAANGLDELGDVCCEECIDRHVCGAAWIRPVLLSILE